MARLELPSRQGQEVPEAPPMHLRPRIIWEGVLTSRL